MPVLQNRNNNNNPDDDDMDSKEEACLIGSLRATSAFLAILGFACTGLWVAWISVETTLVDVGVNNKVINLTDIICTCVNFVIALLSLCYAILLEKEACHPIGFAVGSMTIAVAFGVYNIFVITGYGNATETDYDQVIQQLDGMFNISFVVSGNSAGIFGGNITKNSAASSEDNWLFSQAFGAVSLALSVALLSLGSMACCVSREISWMHTTRREEEN